MKIKSDIIIRQVLKGKTARYEKKEKLKQRHCSFIAGTIKTNSSALDILLYSLPKKLSNLHPYVSYRLP